MAKTVIVSVVSLKAHPKYKKIIKTSKRYKAHYEGPDLEVGSKVLIEETKPISKDKKWVVRALSTSEASGNKTLPR